jgi:Nodulation protein Z (NodZ)
MKLLPYLLILIGFPLWSGEFRVIGEQFTRMGMFAAAIQILGQLAIYETKDPVEIDGLLIDFGTLGLYYDPGYGPNWWNYYFEPICIGNPEKGVVSQSPKSCYYQGFKKMRRTTRSQASELVKKYIHVRKPILEKAEQFVSRHFTDFYVIGVHYRGTDKSREAPRVPYEKVFQMIAEQLPQNKPCRIFIATDEQKFLEEARQMFPGSVIACEAHRSETERGVHLSHRNSYAVGEEALIDALLLSKCHLLVRTSSNLSLWSTYFNPELPVILLNNSYRSHENTEPE